MEQEVRCASAPARTRLLASMLIAVALGASAAEGAASNRDPVVLTLHSDSSELQMELGLIEEVRVLARAHGYALTISFSPDGLRYYKQFLSQSKGARVELYICSDGLPRGAELDMKGGFISIDGLKDRKQAEEIADVLWYGKGCNRFLKQDGG